MKTIKTLCIVFSLATLMSACTKNETIEPNANTGTQNIKNGSWSVTYFYDKEKDETHKFSGYTLTFEEDGVLTLSNTSGTLTGSWSLKNNSDDSSSSSQKLILMISGNEVADELADDWKIIQMSDTFIQLEDDSDNHTEVLELTQI